MLSKIELLLMSIWIILFYHFKGTHITRAAHQKIPFAWSFPSFFFIFFYFTTQKTREMGLSLLKFQIHTNHWPTSDRQQCKWRTCAFVTRRTSFTVTDTNLSNTFIRHNHRCSSIVITNFVKILEFCLIFLCAFAVLPWCVDICKQTSQATLLCI